MLDLQNEQLSYYACEKLFKILKYNNHFKRVNLAQNQIGDQSIPALIDMLSGNKTMVELNIASNGITN